MRVRLTILVLAVPTVLWAFLATLLIETAYALRSAWIDSLMEVRAIRTAWQTRRIDLEDFQ